MRRISGVYGIVHGPTGAIYVGSSKNVRMRWWHHANRLGHGKHHATALQELWTRDGADAFRFFILDECEIEHLAAREQEWIDSFETILNASRFAKCGMLDPRIAEKVAAKHRGRKRPAEVGEKIAAALRGKPLSEERKRKISEAHLARTAPSEAQLAHRERLHADLRNTDKRYILREITSTPEGRAKQIASHWSRGPNAEEIARRISEANTGKPKRRQTSSTKEAQSL